MCMGCNIKYSPTLRLSIFTGARDRDKNTTYVVKLYIFYTTQGNIAPHKNYPGICTVRLPTDPSHILSGSFVP